MFPLPSFIIEWSKLIDQIILAGERLYHVFLSFGYWFTAPVSECFGSVLSPFYLPLLGPFFDGLASLEFTFNLMTNGRYGDIVSSLLGTDSITGISMLSVIGCNILLLVFLRFVKWLWDVIPVL